MSAPVVGLGRTPAVAPDHRRPGQLLQAAFPGAEDDDNPFGGHWSQGVCVWPEAAPVWRMVSDRGDPDDHPDYGVREAGALPYGAIPVTPQVLIQCPRTNDLDELVYRAQRQMEAVTSQAMARELWVGDLTRSAPWAYAGDNVHTLANPRPSGGGDDVGDPWVNPYLVDADMLPAADHPADAVGLVEAAAMARLPGGPVFIHVPPMWLLQLTQFGIHAEGDVLRTPLGSVVVADAGYGAAVLDANDPADLAVYASGPVQAWLGDIRVFAEPHEVVELDTNAIGVWAERPALALFDPQTLVGCAIT